VDIITKGLNEPIAPGLYEHFKGGRYTVLGVAKHSETGERLVVYRAEYGDRDLWVRPAEMFAEEVNSAGKMVPRFKYLGD